MPVSQLGGLTVVDMTVQVKHSRFEGQDGAVREDQLQSGRMVYSIWIINQGDPQLLVKSIAAPVMVTAHQVQLAIEQRY